MGNFEKGTPLITGFSLSSPMPLDTRLVLQNTTELAALPNVQRYVGMYVYLVDEDIQLRLTTHGWEINRTGFIKGEGAPSNDIGSGGDMYIDITECDVYFKEITDPSTMTTEWVYQLSIKGATGDTGPKGPTGTRGSKWYSGENITGVVDSGVVFPGSGIINALQGDHYLHFNGNVYECTLSGTPDVAEWTFRTSIMGPKGEQGDRGPGIVTGQSVFGDIENEDGQAFPDLGDDGNVYLPNDLYLNDDTGELYKCVGGGPTLGSAVWIKLGTLITTNNTSSYSFDITLHENQWVKDEESNIWKQEVDINDILLGVLVNAFAKDITHVETIPAISGSVDEALEILDTEILCKEVRYNDRILVFHAIAKPAIDVVYTLSVETAKPFSTANIQEIIDAVTKKIENPISIDAYSEDELIILSSDRDNSVFKYVTIDHDQTGEQMIVTAQPGSSLFDKISFNVNADEEDENENVGSLQFIENKVAEDHVIINESEELASVLGSVQDIITQAQAGNIVVDEDEESITIPKLSKGGNE